MGGKRLIEHRPATSRKHGVALAQPTRAGSSARAPWAAETSEPVGNGGTYH
ncbi:hypothetical protein GCM10009546_07470 [Actinomadura livida]|uniref:Uncharacterized protein n=1 Tax=Actinomadura livida TaxID=79909 RepID=A0A7W7IIR3_9ACTN|nr:hypothetical protein [Actinomadura catellatispora]GGT98147.1 hypothetical protein GCM10010208_22080 [Actinomadura livida]